MVSSIIPLRVFANEQSSQAAISVIDRFNQTLLVGMKCGKQILFAQRFQRLSVAVDLAFDLPTILSASIGQSWLRFSPEEQKNLTETFRRYTISSYVANFDEYSGQTFICLPEIRQLDDVKILVQSRMAPSSGTAIEIDYVMQPTPLEWKVVDVLLAGSISRVAVQRSDFRHIIANGGAEALIAELDTKTSQMSGKTVS
ncbi:unnamed protein product [Sphagnum tenellum]